MNFQFKVVRRLIFFFGDLRRLQKFPFLTWDVSEHLIDYNEIENMLHLLRPGDVILHRDRGYASNFFIGGAMTHAGLYIGNKQLVEAISEGVKRRHVTHILHSDYAIVLRPQLSDRQKAQACGEALQLQGCPYDVMFDFCDENDRMNILEKNEIQPFCCTEIPHFVYMPYDLGINRRRNISMITRLLNLMGSHPGKTVIDADMYVKAYGFDIIWKSKHATAEWAAEMGCSDEYVAKFRKHELAGKVNG